ncbi:hypothetical protein FQA39_LY05986 [Lamprigera yunnana]|nr:hypothetical protein FQA39_LY05986 [Lamprigera yunnana]
MANWTRAIVSNLIYIYKSHECLWKVDSNDYKNNSLRLEAWSAIANQLNAESKINVAPADIQKKINGLRTNFMKELKLLEGSKRSGGGKQDGIDSIYEPSWWAFYIMSFLKDYVKPITIGPSNLQLDNNCTTADVNNIMEFIDSEGVSKATIDAVVYVGMQPNCSNVVGDLRVIRLTLHPTGLKRIHVIVNHGNSGKQSEKPPPGPISVEIKLQATPNLEPKHLTVKPSVLRNDLMWQDFEMEGFDGLVAYKPRSNFAETYEGFPGLVDRVYETVCLADPAFRKYVSCAMCPYYLWQHLFARCIAIKKHQADQTVAEDRFLKFMHNSIYPVPSTVKEYLRSIRTTTDRTGIEYRLDFIVWPNREGHFGRVDEETHYAYETMAAPVVLAKRILKDLRYTQRQQDRNWDLPNTIRPEANEDQAYQPRMDGHHLQHSPSSCPK